ncbi:MAG: 16S rRNA methyltransferase [Thermosphaera sp.]
MGKLKIAILEAGVELVPKEISNHPSVVKNAARRGKPPAHTLLDVSIHYSAMLRIRDRFKRGRPDIVHVTLLEALESPLNKKGLLEIYVHTYDGKAIFIHPSTRIPRNYNRFTGLMEQLLVEGKVPPGSPEPLLQAKSMRLPDLVRAAGASGLLLLREECERESVRSVVVKALNNALLIGVGGFPHGDFSQETLEAADYCYSIYEESLMTWVVASRLISTAELLANIL